MYIRISETLWQTFCYSGFGFFYAINKTFQIMKKIIIALFLMFVSTIGFTQQRAQNQNYQTVGYINTNGRIENQNYQCIGYIKDDGRVENQNYQCIGYINKDGKI